MLLGTSILKVAQNGGIETWLPNLDIEIESLVLRLGNIFFSFRDLKSIIESIDFSILLRFGITAGVGSYIGSLIISHLGQDVIFYDYKVFNQIFINLNLLILLYFNWLNL